MSHVQCETIDGLTHAVLSDIGMRRANNQDSFAVSLAADRRQRQMQGDLFLVADGMGAHAAGELASRMAAESIPHTYRKFRDIPHHVAIESAIAEANQRIHQRGEANFEFRNMGTTCTSLLLAPQGVIIGHVGDSRAYRLRGRRIEQLSFDHSLAWEMRELNPMAEDDESLNAIPKNVITRSLGPSPTVKVDLEGPLPVETGDRYLLCSDGLTGRVSDEEIAAALFYLDPKNAVQFLVDLANVRGGTDNTTIVTVMVGEAKRGGESDPAENGADTRLIGAEKSLLAKLGGALKSLWYRPPETRPRAAGCMGRAPYRSAEAAGAREFTADLKQIVIAGRQAAEHRGWAVDWSGVIASVQSADELTEAGSHAAALCQQAESLHLFMQHCYRNLRR